MAQVGTKREPRLPTGPPIVNKLDDDTILDPSTSNDESTKKAEEKKKEDKFEEVKIAKVTPPPSKVLRDGNTDLFYKWLAELTVEQFAQLSWYLYRLWPRIERAPEKKYIDCGNYAINEQWILDNHGSGDYMFICNEAGKPKNAKTICTAYVKNLTHPEYPPKVVMSELDVHFPSNKTYVDRMVAEGKLTVDLKPMNTTQTNGGLSDQIILRLIDKIDRGNLSNLKDPKDNAINTAIEIMAKGNQAATQMMLDQMKAEDPEKLLKLMTLMFSMVPKPIEHKDESGSQTMKFLEIMAKKDETIMNLMMKMVEKASAPQVASEDGSFDKTIDRFMKFMELTGMEGLVGGKKSTLEVALQYGAPILERALGIAQNLLALKAQGAPKTDQSAANQTQQTIMPLAVSSAPIVETDGTGKPINNQTKDPREAMLAQSGEQEEMIKQGLKQIGPKIIEALSRGTTGDDFAESIDHFLGPMVYNQLASLGETKMIEILKTDEQLWNTLKTVEPALRQFIHEFIEYGKADDGEIIDANINTNEKETKLQ